MRENYYRFPNTLYLDTNQSSFRVRDGRSTNLINYNTNEFPQLYLFYFTN